MGWETVTAVMKTLGVALAAGGPLAHLGERAQLTRRLRQTLDLLAVLPPTLSHRPLRAAYEYRAERLSERLTAIENRRIRLRKDEWEYDGQTGVIFTLLGVLIMLLGGAVTVLASGTGGVGLAVIVQIAAFVLAFTGLISPAFMLPAPLRHASLRGRVRWLVRPLRRALERRRGTHRRPNWWRTQRTEPLPQVRPVPSGRPGYVQHDLADTLPTFGSLRSAIWARDHADIS